MNLIQQQLVDRYAMACRFYRALGVVHRQYCDRFVRQNFPPLTWTASTTDPWQPDPDAAYDAACTKESVIG